MIHELTNDERSASPGVASFSLSSETIEITPLGFGVPSVFITSVWLKENSFWNLYVLMDERKSTFFGRKSFDNWASGMDNHVRSSKIKD